MNEKIFLCQSISLFYYIYIMNKYTNFYLLFFFATTISCASKKHLSSKEKIAVQQSITLKSEIDSWLNVPYKYGGNNKQGVDCSGFVNAIYLAVYKIKLPRTTKELFKLSTPIKKENLKEGDLVFFKITGNDVSHVGIFIKENQFVHSSSSKGVIVSLLNNSYYQSHFLGGGRIR